MQQNKYNPIISAAMSDALIKDLRMSLTKLNRVIKKDVSLDDENIVELKELIQEIVSLTGNIEGFIYSMKAKKNPKMLEKMKKQQEIEKKLFKQFMPLIMACNIMLNNDESESKN